MALTSGFYNSINKDRVYNATQFSQIFDGIINDGVYQNVGDWFKVRASGAGMSVVVGKGRAWFDRTWTYNDSDYVVTLQQSEFIAKRIDAIVLKINTNDSVRENTIEVITGIPSETPEKPIFEDSNKISFHPLAYVYLNADTEIITDDMIENVVGIDDRTPFVTGIIEHVTADQLITQWEFEYKKWMEQKEISYLEWSTNEKKMFDNWFENLHYVLDGDVAGHLQNEIDDIIEKDFLKYYELCNKNIHIERNSSGDIIRVVSSDGYSVTQTTTFEKTLTETIITTRVVIDSSTYVKIVTISGDDVTQVYSKT